MRTTGLLKLMKRHLLQKMLCLAIALCSIKYIALSRDKKIKGNFILVMLHGSSMEALVLLFVCAPSILLTLVFRLFIVSKQEKLFLYGLLGS